MKRILTGLLWLLGSSSLMAGAFDDIYATAQLEKDKPRLERRINELYQAGLHDFMSGFEQQAVAGTRIELPLRGESPLDAYSIIEAGEKRVVLPVMSLKFIEDLCTAYAWRHVNNYTFAPIDEYLAMLKYRRPQDFPGGRLPDPLTALGVPDRIWEKDKRVDELSLRFRNTAWAFILAHEVAHLRFRHPGNQRVSPRASQRNEEQADAYAMELLARSDTIPMGMILWFQATIGIFPNRADFDSVHDFLNWTSKSATHPVNPRRLQRLGSYMDLAAAGSLSPSQAESMRFIAGRLVAMADMLAEPDMHQLIVRCAVKGDPKNLRRQQGDECLPGDSGR